MKLLTIVIPAYNVEKYLDEAIAPYEKMIHPERVEVLIVNDGSTDGTLKKAREYEEKYPEFIKVIDKENGGHGSTINAGIRQATGKYFKVVDGDDWIDEKALENLLNMMENTTVDLIATGFVIVCEDTHETEEIHIDNVEYGKKYQFENICSKIDYIRMHSAIFRTQILKDNKVTLDEHCFYVDVEHDLLPIKWIHTVIFCDELLYRYRIGRPGQSVNMKSMIKNRENHERVIKRILKMVKSDNYPATVVDYIYRKLENMIGFQYSILIALGSDKKAKRELIEFDTWLKSADKKLYKSVKQKKILLLRAMNFHNYYAVQFIYHLCGKKEEYVK